MKILFGFFVVLISFAVAFYLTKFDNVGNKLTEVLPRNEVVTSATPFSLKEAPSESLKGNLTILTNEVSWQDRVATESSIISKDILIQQGEVVETNENGKAQLRFPNIANLIIYQNSSLNIIQTLPVNLVFLINRGKVDFEKLGQNTVSIRSKHLLANIEGNVRISISEEKPIITIQVFAGSAKLAYNNLKFETQSFDVRGGETVEFNDSSRKVVLK